MRSWFFINVILSHNNVIICFRFLVFFDALRILPMNDLTSWRNLVLNSTNLSKKWFLNWTNYSLKSFFSVSISWKCSFGSDIHSRFRNVLTTTDLFSIKQFHVSVKTSEDILNSKDSFTKFTLLVYYIFSCFYSACVLKI